MRTSWICHMASFGCLSFVSAASAAGLPALPADGNPSLPREISSTLASTDTVLAFKVGDAYGDGLPAAALVVRHAVGEDKSYDFSSNPCDLVVFRTLSGKFSAADKSSRAVDCTYNNLARKAGHLDLDDNLALKPGSIVFFNEKEKGGSTFSFAYSKEKNAWYLSSAAATFPVEAGVAEEKVSYPKHFSWTPMSAVDPEALAKIMAKHRTLVK